MKIVDRKEFLSLPENTVYSLFTPCYFDGFFVKSSPAGSMPNDWFYDDLVCPVDADDSNAFSEILLAADEDADLSVSLDFNYTGRDGTFKEDQKFAVYAVDDVRALIERLSECVPISRPEEPKA